MSKVEKVSCQLLKSASDRFQFDIHLLMLIISASNYLSRVAVTIRNYLKLDKIKGQKVMGRWFMIDDDIVQGSSVRENFTRVVLAEITPLFQVRGVT